MKARDNLPGRDTSRLIERPIGEADTRDRVQSAPEAARWALALAGFGQKLRHDPWVSDSFGGARSAAWPRARGATIRSGLRAQFVHLARAARETRSLNE